MIRRDFVARFRGSVLGLSWAVLQPVALVTLYWLVFTYFVSRGPGSTEPYYVNFLITGLIPWLAFNEAVVRSMTAIVDNGSVVRRLATRSELIVIVPNASAILFEVIALALFVIALAARGQFPRMIWLLPIAVALQLALQIGLGWILSVVYVFFRDLGQVVTFGLAVAFYLSPVLYRVVPRFEGFFAWNPMTPLLGLYRSAMLSDALPDAGSIVFLLIVTAVLFSVGALFYRRERGTLADVI